MLKTMDKKGNIIYGDLSLQKDLKLEFRGGGNVVFFAGSSYRADINFHYNNSLVFIGDNTGSYDKGLRIEIFNDSVCYIGNNNTFGQTIMDVCESKNIIMANDCMFSIDIYLNTTDHHLIFDGNTYKRANFGKSIYIGDHVWCGIGVTVLKKSFVASGSILGAKSVNVGKKFSNAIYAGNPSKLIKKNHFWDRKYASDFTKEQVKHYTTMQKDDHKFDFEKEKFLDPNLLEKELERLETAGQKLEFVYDYLYNNTHKNRFALFEDSDVSECKLYKDESKMPFSKLQFEIKKPSSAKNHLSYKLGMVMIENSKSLKGYLKMPFLLYKIQKEHKKSLKTQEKLENLNNAKFKNHLCYKLGNALIQAQKTWYKGGYIWFCFKVLKIKKRFQKK